MPNVLKQFDITKNWLVSLKFVWYFHGWYEHNESMSDLFVYTCAHY